MRNPQVVESLLRIHQETNGGPMSGMLVSVAYMPPVDWQGNVVSTGGQDDDLGPGNFHYSGTTLFWSR